MNQEEIQKITEYGPIAGLAMNMYQFVANGLDLNKPIYNFTGATSVLARNYFLDIGWGFVVRNGELPFDVDVKGAFVTKKRKNNSPVLELSEINFSELEEILKDEKIDFSLKGRTLYTKKGIKLLGSNTKNSNYKGRTTRRTRLTLVPQHNDYENVDLAFQSLKLIYGHDLFTSDPFIEQELTKEYESSTESSSKKGKQGMEMRQIQKIHQILRNEQNLILEGRLSQRMMQNMSVLRMDSETLIREVERQMGLILKRKALSRIIDTAKEVGQKITLQQANSIFRNITKRRLG